MTYNHYFETPLVLKLDGPIVVKLGDVEIPPAQYDSLVKQITDAVSTRIAGQLSPQIQEILKAMATFAEDESRLETDVQANTAAIGKFADLAKQDQSTIVDLKQQVADLKAAAVDTTALEATIAKLEENNATATGLGTPAA